MILFQAQISWLGRPCHTQYATDPCVSSLIAPHSPDTFPHAALSSLIAVITKSHLGTIRQGSVPRPRIQWYAVKSNIDGRLNSRVSYNGDLSWYLTWGERTPVMRGNFSGILLYWLTLKTGFIACTSCERAAPFAHGFITTHTDQSSYPSDSNGFITTHTDQNSYPSDSICSDWHSQQFPQYMCLWCAPCEAIPYDCIVPTGAHLIWEHHNAIWSAAYKLYYINPTGSKARENVKWVGRTTIVLETRFTNIYNYMDFTIVSIMGKCHGKTARYIFTRSILVAFLSKHGHENKRSLRIHIQGVCPNSLSIHAHLLCFLLNKQLPR